MSDILYKSNPSMFKDSPVKFVICVVTIVGWLYLIVWWLQSKASSITIDSEKTILQFGILSKSVNEVFHCDVRNIKVDQTFFQRLFGVGAISISSAGQSDEEIIIGGIPSPAKAKDIINNMRKQGNSSTMIQPVATASAADELDKLAKLHKDGHLTDEEFKEQKAKVLA